MLMRTDPFRELDRWAQQVRGTWSQPSPLAMDAYRAGDEFVLVFDLPGVSSDAIEVEVERDMLTVKAERRPVALPGDARMHLTERPLGVFSRRLVLGDSLDTEHIHATHADGVLTLRIPITERAKPRKIEISRDAAKQITS